MLTDLLNSSCIGLSYNYERVNQTEEYGFRTQIKHLTNSFPGSKNKIILNLVKEV